MAQLTSEPDLTAEQWRRLEDVGIMPIPPDFAVEVISPNDLAREVNKTVEEYLAAGFKLIWVVSPEMRMVDVYHADGGIARLRANDAITAESVLPEFRCQVADFFN